MLHIKENPKGIDVPIQGLQEHLYGNLCRMWGLSDVEYNAFGRIYRNQTDRGYIPEAYVGNCEYRETFLDDGAPATSFFVADNAAEVSNTGRMTSRVSLIFCVNLARIKPDIKHRGDEEAHLDVTGLCNIYVRSLNSIVTGMDAVFKEFPALRTKFRDLHPFHCFRIDLSMSYQKC